MRGLPGAIIVFVLLGILCTEFVPFYDEDNDKTGKYQKIEAALKQMPFHKTENGRVVLTDTHWEGILGDANVVSKPYDFFYIRDGYVYGFRYETRDELGVVITNHEFEEIAAKAKELNKYDFFLQEDYGAFGIVKGANEKVTSLNTGKYIRAGEGKMFGLFVRFFADTSSDVEVLKELTKPKRGYKYSWSPIRLI